MNHLRLPQLNHLTAGSIYCIGRNYAEHARELQNEVPDRPMVFLKPRSSLLGDGGTVLLPPQSREVHHEVELVAAIGPRTAGDDSWDNGRKHIPEERALEAVAGYAVGLDVTARDIQQKAKEKGHPWTVAKGFDTFAPLGPFVPAAEIPDPQDLVLSISVNGELRQEDSTALMLFPVARLIAWLSTIFTLMPGDLLFTGTPKGVSPLADGDRIEATMGGGLSSLRVDVKDASH